ncbi:MAG: translocation/assembly module TamB domain-containing protein [Gammaproteobacteria bacterium]|nr:translocation/assembly module TamB domain-containing protein [Gammaproteobacteria bacterium]
MRWAGRLFVALAAFLLLLAAGLYALLSTGTGTRLLLRAAQAGGVSIEIRRISGGLLGPLVLDGVRARFADTTIVAHRLRLEWRPSALLRRELSIRQLRIDDLEIRLPPSRKSTVPPGTPVMPQRLPGGFGVRLDALQIDRLRVGRSDAAPLALSALTICARWRSAVLTLCPSGATLAGAGPITAAGQAQLGRDKLRLDRLRLTAGLAQVSAQGRIGYGATQSALTLRFSALRWPLDNGRPASLHDGRGTLTLDGRPQDYRYRLTAEGKLRDRPQTFTLQAAGSGGLQRLVFDSLQLTAGGGRIRGQGALAWAPKLAGELQLRFTHADPALLAAEFPGDLNGTLAAHTGADGAVVWSLSLRHSRLRGYPLSAAVAGVWRWPALQLTQLSLSSGATKLSASGRLTPAFDLEFSLQSPDLASLYPGFGGRLRAQGRLQGEPADPHLVLSASGNGLRFGRYTLAQFDLDADLDPERPSRLNLKLSEAQAGLAIRRARLSATGTLAYQQIDLDAGTARGSLTLTAAGGYDRRRREWGGSLLTAHLTPQGLGALHLERPAGILIGGGRKSLEPACVSGDDGRVCVQLQHNVPSPGWWLTWSLRRARLAALAPLLPDGWRVAGQADGDGRLRLVAGNLQQLTAHLQLSGAGLKLPDAAEFTLDSGRLDAEQDADGRLRAQLALQLPQGSLQAQAQAAPGGQLLQRALSGEFGVDFPSIAFLQPLLPQATDLSGRIQGRLTLTGTLGRPRLAGRVGLVGGRAKLIVPNIRLSEVQLALIADGSGPVRLAGSLSSGGGSLKLDGGVDPSANPLHGELHVSGRDFQAMDTSQARIWVSPDLSLEYFPGFFKLSGTLAVPKADITPSGLTDKGIEPSADQVLIGGPPKPPPTPLTTVAAVTLKLGEQVRFKGFGLTTRLGGAVKLIDYTKLPQALAQGELNLLDGHYQAYGQDLKIEHGRLIFSGGPATRPAIDVLASRKPASNVTVRLQVRGPLAQPEFTLSSDPPMPRDQQLAWLVLGHPLNQSSGGDKQAVSSAALGLGLAGGDFLANRIGKRLGLDTVSVGADSGGGSQVATSQSMIERISGTSTTPQTSATALTLGKYLTPRLFVSYGVGLLQPGNVFRLLYDLGHGFRLEAESGLASGGDLVYTVDSK